MNEEIVVFSWFRIHFIENPGMAFGMELEIGYGKLILSLFRIVAVFFIGYYLYTLVKQRASFGLLASIALILSGALGNIIDSAVYGLIFSESGFHTPATMFPAEGGYESFLHGRVVDMLYFPIIDEPIKFFQPIFNIADSAISIGVAMVIIFYRQFFGEEEQPKTTADASQSSPTPQETDVQ